MGRLKLLNDTKMILNDIGGYSCQFMSNLVSFRTFRHPQFSKPVSCPGLFLPLLTARLLQQIKLRTKISIVLHKIDHKIDFIHDRGPKLGNLIVVLNQDLKFISSDSAQKLKCSSSARLGSKPFQLGSVQLRKFQLELIATINSTEQC